MARYVIDAPTLVHLVTHDLTPDPAHQLVAPNAIRSQALDLLLSRVRAGDLGEKEALAHQERITETRMRLLGDRVSRRTAWDLAREYDWPTVRDAEYLAVGKLQADALVTVDEGLAATAEGIIPVAPLEVLLAP